MRGRPLLSQWQNLTAIQGALILKSPPPPFPHLSSVHARAPDLLGCRLLQAHMGAFLVPLPRAAPSFKCALICSPGQGERAWRGAGEVQVAWEVEPCRQEHLASPSPPRGPQPPSPASVPSLATFQPKTSFRLLPKVRLRLGALASPRCHNVGPGTAASSCTLPSPHLCGWWGLRKDFWKGQRRNCQIAGSVSQLLEVPRHRRQRGHMAQWKLPQATSFSLL